MQSNVSYAYIATATLLTMAPGLDTAMVLRSATANGVRNGAATSVGIALGCLCWGTSAAFGLAKLMQSLPAAVVVLQVAGACYLGWIGAQLILRSPSGRAEAAGSKSKSDLIQSARVGFTTNILNPKVGLFYLTLLPQFAPKDEASARITWLLVLVHVAIAASWFTLLSVVAGGVRPILQSPRAIVAVNRVTGGLFVALGMMLIRGAAVA